MIRVLTILNDEMNELNIPYTFNAWGEDVELPQFVGEISEVPTVDEDGMNEYSFILTGYSTSYVELFRFADQIRNKYKTSQVINGIVIKYEKAMTVDGGSEELKQIQIDLKIKEWGVV